jgi:hypothetical protein
MRPKTIVYVDGFNLYYGLRARAKQANLAAPEHRWLNLYKLAQFLLADSEIVQVRYFTSLVKPEPSDPQVPVRQQIFLRALATVPQITVELGRFQSNPRLRPRDTPCGQCGDRFARIIERSEKGSDVNLASRLLADAYEGLCERAAVVSNDSDLALPIEMASRLLPRGVVVISPHPGKPTYRLAAAATEYRKLRSKTLAAAVFPDSLSDGHGVFAKPSSW